MTRFDDISVYFQVVLIENTIMILLWWQRRTIEKWYNIPALCSVWGGFALGETVKLFSL